MIWNIAGLASLAGRRRLGELLTVKPVLPQGLHPSTGTRHRHSAATAFAGGRPRPSSAARSTWRGHDERQSRKASISQLAAGPGGLETLRSAYIGYSP